MKALTLKLGIPATKLYLRKYFANKARPTDIAIRRMEFALFFFGDSLSDDPPAFHLTLFEDLASPINSADAAPRGHAKTTILSVEIIYRIVNGLSHFVLPISDTYSQARDQVDNVRQELEGNPLLRWVYGDLTSDWHWTSGAFTTANEVRVVARGSNMKVRGLKYRQWRPDFVAIDDLENDEAVMKSERREKLMNWVKRAVLPAMSPDGKVGLVGTVLHDDSLLNNALKGEKGFGGWRRNKFAAISTDEQDREQSLWPSRFPLETLKRMREDPTYERYLGPIAFSQEMQNEAIDDTSRVIKREWIFGTDEKPYPYSFTAKEEMYRATHDGLNMKDDYIKSLVMGSHWIKNEMKQILMAVDPAISEKTTADFFAMVVIGVDKMGDIWILDIFRDRIADIDQQVQRILEFNDKWRPDRIKVESVAYQAGLARAVQRQAAVNGRHAPVFQVKPDKDKFRRAVIHSANFAGGLVHLRTDHPLFETFVKEILDFPVGEHDDMLDAYMHAAEELVKRHTTRAFANKPAGF